MKIKVEKLTEKTLHKLGIPNWPIWEKEVSVFDWTYDEVEKFYVIEGEVIVRYGDEKVHIKPGDFVTCAKGLQCVWEIKKNVKKHYQFIEE